MKIIKTTEHRQTLDISLDEADLEKLVLDHVKKTQTLPKGASFRVDFHTSQGCFSGCSVTIESVERS